MHVDWFTVSAQTVNFVILVWLMKRFLYKPILHAIDDREKRIATALADADAKKAEAQKERDEFQHKNEEFDHHRATLLTQATDEAKAERLRLFDEARKAAEAVSVQRQESLRTDANNLNQAICRRTQQEVFAIARKTLTDLAETSLESLMIDVFVRRLRELNGQEKALLTASLKASSSPAIVRTTFDLPPTERASAEGAIRELLGTEIHVEFETAPDLIGGIELTTNGHKVAWSIADYLKSLEQSIDELLNEKNKPAGNVDPKPEEPKPENKSR